MDRLKVSVKATIGHSILNTIIPVKERAAMAIKQDGGLVGGEYLLGDQPATYGMGIIGCRSAVRTGKVQLQLLANFSSDQATVGQEFPELGYRQGHVIRSLI